MKLISCLLTGCLALFSTVVSAADKTWTGELYNIVPNKAGITEAYCKSHCLDTYKTNFQDQQKEVIAENGVRARDINTSAKQDNGITFYTADVMFSGNDGKHWEEKANFYYYALTNNSPLQGVWYTKNCKGFYKSGPA